MYFEGGDVKVLFLLGFILMVLVKDFVILNEVKIYFIELVEIDGEYLIFFVGDICKRSK